MQRVHFISIGGAAMHNLAIALKKSNLYEVSGSDDEIFDPSLSRLKEHNLLPKKMGWYPERIHKNLDAIILGMHAKKDNPELIKAKELGIKIYSFPEFLYQKTRNKIRVVIGGSHGKTTTTAMILHVMKKLGIKADYMVGAQIEGFENMVSFSHESRIAIFEGDEYLTSPLDLRPKFHIYKPHIAVITGIAWDHINVFPTFENYVEQFRIFADSMEHEGRLIYYEQDQELKKIVKNLRSDIIPFPYDTPKHKVVDGVTYVETRKGEIKLQIFGAHNLQNLQAAQLACKQIGIVQDDFYKAIADFSGASNRLEKIVEKPDRVAFKDFAHSPSKLKATISAVRQQFPNRKLIACMELHTFSSLTKDFLPEYENCMKDADLAYVYFNPEVIKHKELEPLSVESVKSAFGGNNLEVFTDSEKLLNTLRELNYKDSTLLMMTSGNFSGVDLISFTNELLNK